MRWNVTSFGKIFPGLSFIQVETSGISENSDDVVRSEVSLTSVGNCYVFVYPYRHMVILK